MLFDLVEQAQGADKETATYYLAESLYQKGDRGAARTYFDAARDRQRVGSKYYQPALERLVEIAIAQHDTRRDRARSRRSTRSSPAQRLPAVPYVRGKYAFSQGKYDDAIAHFAEVAEGLGLRAAGAVLTGTTYVAKKDLAKATDVFTDLDRAQAADRTSIAA